MTDQSRAEGFATALNGLEQSGDADDLASWFAPGAVLRRPEIEASAERDDADPGDFWRAYLSPFAHVETEFVSIREAGDEAVLEWKSSGALATGRPIRYAGVSLLTFDDQGKVVRFSTYFDTAAFLRREQS